MSDALHLKHRPRKFADVVGQGPTVRSLQGTVKRGEASTFLLSGPSGTGKTTLARIAAHALGVKTKDIVEVDAATFTGVEDMRAIQNMLQYRPFGDSLGRAVIIDEAHGLSKQAWQSLLKVTEEPPPGVYWFFCTTEEGKVPATIKTRCASYSLKPVADRDLGELYDRVCDAEKIDLPGDVGDVIIREAHGSPRQLLVNLEKCRDVRNKKEAAELLRAARESAPAIELCRLLLTGGGSNFSKCIALINKLDNESAEGVRLMVYNYFSSVLNNAKSANQAMLCLKVMECFSKPCYTTGEKLGPIKLAVGHFFFDD